ncbi:MAG: PAS domain-containing protein [Terriglobales bacterium]
MADAIKPSRPILPDLLHTLESSPMVSYAVDENLQVQYCNPAWDRFAVDNGAPELKAERALGTDLRHVIPEDLRPFYLQAFEQAEKSGTVWECLYECSSPQVFRKFQMRIHPLRPPGWALVTNALTSERLHTEVVTAGLVAYVDSYAQITMCSHCRRSRRADKRERWDFVPAHLEPHLSNISHGLCPICLEYFYPQPKDDSPSDSTVA